MCTHVNDFNKAKVQGQAQPESESWALKP